MVKKTFNPSNHKGRYEQLQSRLQTAQNKSARARIEAEMQAIARTMRGAGYGTDGKRLQTAEA